MALSAPFILMVVQTAVIAVFVHMYFFPEQDMESVLRGGGNVGDTTTRINDTYDYIIVGGGSAGSVLAGRLSENSHVTVLVLEAGSSDKNKPTLKIPMAVPQTVNSEHDWHYNTVPQKHACGAMVDQKSTWIAGKVLGGTSQVNYMLYVRGHRLDYDKWATNGCEGWSYKDVLPFFKKSESMQDPDLARLKHHGRVGPLSVRTTRFTSLGDVFVRAGQELGYSVRDTNDGTQEGFGYAQSTVKNGERMSTSAAFLWPNMKRPNLHVAVKTRVTRVLIEDMVATGVEFVQNDRVKTVRARKEVILSAGTVGSPHILMHSGIGPRRHLEEKQIPVHMDLPVGDNLQDHVITPLRVFTRRKLSISKEKIESVFTWLQYFIFKSGYLSSNGVEATAFLKTNSKSPLPDFEIEMLAFMLEPPVMKDFFNIKDEVLQETKWGKGDGFVFLPILLQTNSTGTIRLRTTNPLDYPLIDPKYLSYPEEVKILLKGIRTIQKLLKTKAYQDIGARLEDAPLSICSHLQYDTDEYWECYIRGLSTSAFHQSGTCKMGAADDPTAVVDPQLRVKGISGLRVVDCSVMPTLVSGNTNAPVIMIAEKAADMIKQNL